jgi:hypothetical protein
VSSRIDCRCEMVRLAGRLVGMAGWLVCGTVAARLLYGRFQQGLSVSAMHI